MIYRGLGILAASIILTACGGSSDPDTEIPPSEEVFTPTQQSIESVSVVDALNKPLTSADVVFTPQSQVSNFSVAMAEGSACEVTIADNSLTDMTDEQGNLILEGLIPGTYQVEICKEGISISMLITILDENAATAAVIAAPLTVDEEGNVAELPDNNIIVAVSGIIYSDDGVIANAQVALSGGALTNGAITTVITDENGFYSIVINVNKSKLAALQSATLQVVADGFEKLNIEDQNFTQFSAFSGVNVQLEEVSGDAVAFAYEENFEVLSSGATCGEWTSEVLPSDFNGIDEVEITMGESLWHSHASGLEITNQAYLANLVSLAPNDLSEGKVPNPIEGLSACWYGKTADNGSLEEGNFLNEAKEGEGEYVLGGGTSTSANSGALISPRIDFSAEVAPLALTFKTWWEIEAVNPNENGFDLMSVEYQIEGEADWITFARLNPLADPVGINNLESLPYSSSGFNQAPLWLDQAPISLDSLAGKVFKLRFAFSTKDELYNGFRGWLLDDVKVSYEEGTFPLWNEVDRVLIGDGGEDFPSLSKVFFDDTDETQFSTNLTVRSKDSVTAQLRMYSLDGEALLGVIAIADLVQGEVQDIQLIGEMVEPEVDYKVVVELINTSGQVVANFTFWDEGSTPGPGPDNEVPQ
jgi:hypothetical protein